MLVEAPGRSLLQRGGFVFLRSVRCCLLPTRGQRLLPAGLHIWDTFAVQAPPECYLRLTWQRSVSAWRAGVAAGKLSQDSLAKLQPSGSTRLLALVPFMRGAFKESF